MLRLKHLWIMLLTLAAVAVPVALIGLPLYVFPAVDEVQPSDAILVLGPPMDERLELAERLREEGFADEMVVSVQSSGGQTAEDVALCADDQVTCEVADPSTTRGEVLLVSERATGVEAPSVIIVTSTPHVARTRYIFAKCYPGEFTVVAAEQPDTLAEWAVQYAYQSVAFGKALVEPCPDAASTR